MENKLNLKLKRLPIIKGLIYKNIKILEDITIAKIDREISRELITEEVDCLIKDFLYIKIFGTTKQVLCFQTNMREIRDMLFSYLVKIQHDKDINQVYNCILSII